eukprot:ctg_750.g201
MRGRAVAARGPRRRRSGAAAVHRRGAAARRNRAHRHHHATAAQGVHGARRHASRHPGGRLPARYRAGRSV